MASAPLYGYSLIDDINDHFMNGRRSTVSPPHLALWNCGTPKVELKSTELWG